MSSYPKWQCSVCTYDNWPSATRCTLCKTVRTTLLTKEETRAVKLQFRGGVEQGQANSSVSSSSEGYLRCPSCTYLNTPSSFKCEQCFHVLSDHPESVRHPPLKFSASTPVNPTTADELDKWICPQCTYENWPKSKQCVMCREPVPTIPHSSTIPSTISTNFLPEFNQDTSDREMYDSSSNLGTRRPKSNQRDKLWFGACRALLENDLTPIERYLLNGGRVDRKLTKQECRYLNVCSQVAPSADVQQTDSISPTFAGASASPPTCDDTNACSNGWKFRAGMTLVDLAICLGRTDFINLFIALNGLQATSSAVGVGQIPKAYNSKIPAVGSIMEPGGSLKSGPVRRQPVSGIHPTLHSLLSRTPGTVGNRGVGGGTRSKWMPCEACPAMAKELRHIFAMNIQHNMGEFPCAYLSEWSTFALPSCVSRLPHSVKYLLFSELCDTQAQSELEDDAKAINWWFLREQKQASRLFALWNRTAGDCLLDSVLQACWGIFDRENTLRSTLAESLRNCENSFYPRWRDYEAFQAACHYILDESQCRRDWENVLTAASQPGGALEQIHIFALSHILRRPIIVYGVKYIKNYRDEPIGIANFQGIYLPLLWDHSLCSSNPIFLGYTRGHFTALVPIEPPASATGTTDNCPNQPTSSPPFTRTSSASSSRRQSPTPDESNATVFASNDCQLLSESEGIFPPTTPSQQSFIYLPLVDCQGSLLPIHFSTENDPTQTHTLLREWLDVVYTKRGLPLVRLRLSPRNQLVDRMLDDWIGNYRTIAKMSNQHGTNIIPAYRSKPPPPLQSSSLSTSSSSTSLPEACDRLKYGESSNAKNQDSW